MIEDEKSSFGNTTKQGQLILSPIYLEHDTPNALLTPSVQSLYLGLPHPYFSCSTHVTILKKKIVQLAFEEKWR